MPDDDSLRPLPPPGRIQDLLFEAARLGRTDMIAPLVQAGGDPAARDVNGHTALILACYHDHGDTLESLLAHGAEVDQPDGARGNTALMGAAFKGHAVVAERLLHAGADPEAVNGAGQTALMFAALFARDAIVDALLDRGADPHRRDAAGNSAVSIAASQGNREMVARLTSREHSLA